MRAGNRTVVGARRRSRVWPVLIVLAAVYVPFLVSRIDSFGTFWFVHMGKQTLEAATSSTRLTPALGWQSDIGYDGQYYYALAVDPRHAPDYMPDYPGAAYFSSRALYPLLARGVALGFVSAVPYTMLAINLVAVAAGTLLVGIWLRRRGLSPWLSLLYGLYPGLIFAVFRDLTEPLAFSLVVLAAVVLDGRSRRSVVAGVALLALAGLARETTLVFALGIAVALALTAKDEVTPRVRWRRGLLFATACLAPTLVWRIVITRLVSGSAGEPGDGWRSPIPLHGLFDYWPWDAQHVLIATAVALPAIAALVGLPWLWRQADTRVFGVLLVLNAAAFVVFVPTRADVEFGAASRITVGVLLATIACLPAWSRRGRLTPLAAVLVLLWSLPWYALTAGALDVPGMTLITS